MSDTSERIVDAALRRLQDHPWDRVTIQAIADEAGVGLAEFNAAFASRGAVLAAFVRRIDGTVLAGEFADMADEAPRERLFDVLMSRLDALRPHRAALRSLMRSVRADPALGFGLNALAVRSQAWMLAAAGIEIGGWRGRLAAQGLAVSFARVVRIFVEEDDPGLPRTMAALDRELRSAQERHGRFARIFGPAVRARRANGQSAPFPDDDAAMSADEDIPPTAAASDIATGEAAPDIVSTGAAGDTTTGAAGDMTAGVAAPDIASTGAAGDIATTGAAGDMTAGGAAPDIASTGTARDTMTGGGAGDMPPTGAAVGPADVAPQSEPELFDPAPPEPGSVPEGTAEDAAAPEPSTEPRGPGPDDDGTPSLSGVSNLPADDKGDEDDKDATPTP